MHILRKKIVWKCIVAILVQKFWLLLRNFLLILNILTVTLLRDLNFKQEMTTVSGLRFLKAANDMEIQKL